jgi:Zn-dependent peptidase ImmA (M78 family)
MRKHKVSDCSQFSDHLSEISEETDVSENMISSRRFSLGSFDEQFAQEETTTFDDSEEDVSPTRKNFYSQLVNQLV